MAEIRTVRAGGQIDSPVMAPEQAARYLGIGRTRMYTLLSSGEIPSFRIGRSRKIRLAELDAWIGARVEHRAR